MSGAKAFNSSRNFGARPMTFGHDGLKVATGTGFQAARSASVDSSRNPKTFTVMPCCCCDWTRRETASKRPPAFRETDPVRWADLIIQQLKTKILKLSELSRC